MNPIPIVSFVFAMFDHAAAADFKRFLRRSRPHKKVEGRSGGEIVQAEVAE